MSEELIVRQCSPTLAGIKTGNLFSCIFESVAELREEIRRLNRRLSKKGLRILPLRIQEKTALIYVYRPSKLKEDFSSYDVAILLAKHGYRWHQPDQCVVRLVSRFKLQEEFPHEIGLFLGYPPEDVKGFIENHAKASKYEGCWKVYGNVEQAKNMFERYKKCTDNYVYQLKNGNSIEKLTVDY